MSTTPKKLIILKKSNPRLYINIPSNTIKKSITKENPLLILKVK